MIILYIFLAIAILLLMIVIHEFGHYVAGKLLNFKINEFSVGFGPKIISKVKQNGERFSLRAIPLGGYCAFEDENGEDGATNEKSFVSEPVYKRIIVFLAGATFNIISAVIFSLIFIWIVGFTVPTVDEVYFNPSNQIAYNPLIIGDKIVAVNDSKVKDMTDFEKLTQGLSIGDNVTLTIVRNDEKIKIIVTKQEILVEGETYEGFGFLPKRKKGFVPALTDCIPFTLKLSWSILGAFGDIVTGKIPLTSLSGPVGTVEQMAEVSLINWRNIFLLLPLIASNLAVFNLLPFPALDGSKVIFAVIEWIRGKPVNRQVENMFHFAGIIFLLGLVIVLDLIGLFR